MARLMGIDYGEKRTGIAVTDEMQLIASALTTKPTAELLDFLEGYLLKEKVDTVVVGAPKRMNNQESEVEEKIRKFLDKLKARFPDLKVVRYDERFTSKMAFQSMIDGGVKKKKRRDKALLDQVSATLILQSYMEANP
ncbi:Holliday junction resolvase RuvX [Robertkochia aurantiaca]|uniref:Holliday junction resolvase RuvX n=1 Tax=Robertkochia aurantiaca TaxID=2873700 RepID=UPI001CCD13B1|nr:Holliday junction resolvase RuvX [Robertkochia sp. 3YJGBD-33]